MGRGAGYEVESGGEDGTVQHDDGDIDGFPGKGAGCAGDCAGVKAVDSVGRSGGSAGANVLRGSSNQLEQPPSISPGGQSGLLEQTPSILPGGERDTPSIPLEKTPSIPPLT